MYRCGKKKSDFEKLAMLRSHVIRGNDCPAVGCWTYWKEITWCFLMLYMRDLKPIYTLASNSIWHSQWKSGWSSIPLRGYRSRHFLKCRRLRNVKILPLHPTSPRGHQKMRRLPPHLSVPFTKREIEAKYFILSPLSAAPALFLSFFHRNVNYCSFMRNTCSSITYKVGNR